jgi:hypothetical protein
VAAGTERSAAPGRPPPAAFPLKPEEGSVTTDHDQQAQAVGLFLTDALLQI